VIDQLTNFFVAGERTYDFPIDRIAVGDRGAQLAERVALAHRLVRGGALSLWRNRPGHDVPKTSALARAPSYLSRFLFRGVLGHRFDQILDRARDRHAGGVGIGLL
jgi:hypothetical protein